MGKCLHHFLVADHLLYKRGLLSSCLRLQLEHGKCLFRNEACHKQGDRRDDHDRHRDPHADRQHENQCSKDGHDTGKELGKSHQKSVRELIDIRDHAAHNLSVGMSVQIFQRKLFNLLERLRPDIPDHIVGNFIVAGIHHPLCHCRQSDDDRHLSENHKDPGKVNVSLSHDPVDRLTDQNRKIQGKRHRHRRENDRCSQVSPVSSDVSQNLTQR